MHPNSPAKRLKVCELGPSLLLGLCCSWLRHWSVPGWEARSCCRSLWIHFSKVCYPSSAWKKQTNKSIHTWHVTLKTCFRPKIQLRQNNYTRLHDISYLTRCCLGLVRTCKRVQIIFRVFSLVRVWVCCSAGALTSFCHVTGLTGCLALGGLWPTKPWNIWNLHGIQNHHFEAKIMIIIKMLRASLFKAM